MKNFNGMHERNLLQEKTISPPSRQLAPRFLGLSLKVGAANLYGAVDVDAAVCVRGYHALGLVPVLTMHTFLLSKFHRSANHY